MIKLIWVIVKGDNMKKLIATSTFTITLVSVSYATELKGSDYILTDVGTTYCYKRIDI